MDNFRICIQATDRSVTANSSLRRSRRTSSRSNGINRRAVIISSVVSESTLVLCRLCCGLTVCFRWFCVCCSSSMEKRQAYQKKSAELVVTRYTWFLFSKFCYSSFTIEGLHVQRILFRMTPNFEFGGKKDLEIEKNLHELIPNIKF